MSWPRSLIGLSALVAGLWGEAGHASSAAERYHAAEKALRLHCPYSSFLHDDAEVAVHALQDLRRASADVTLELLTRKPGATATELAQALCALDPPTEGCLADEGELASVVPLAPGLFAVAEFSGNESGTVFIVGPRHGLPALLWSIDAPEPQPLDAAGLLGGWRADQSGLKCREKGSPHPPGTCGPLYARLLLLTPDAVGRPRFLVDAGYAQEMGSTIAKQASIWSWDGEGARLLWIAWYDFMIEQKVGDSFAGDILSLGGKDEFRSFFTCGSCEARQVVRRLRVTPTAIQDLGKVSLTPELDLVDELFWRLSQGAPTAELASLQVSNRLRPLIQQARGEAETISPTYFTTGGLEGLSVRPVPGGAKYCFTVEGDVGQLEFTVRTRAGRAPRFTHVTRRSGAKADCSQ